MKLVSVVEISKDIFNKPCLLTSFGLIFIQFKSRADFPIESELLEVFLEVNETKEMPQGCKLTLSNVVTRHETSV